MTQLEFNIALLGLQDKLLYYALSLTLDREKAKDLLQDTFLKALTHRDKFIQNTNFKAWIYMIMKNTFINNYHRNIKVKNIFDVSNNDFHLKFSYDKSYPSSESIYSSKEIIKYIHALNDDYKVPFTMFLDGYKYREIAKVFNLPVGTVKSRIFFARKKLQKSLTEYSS